MPKTKDHIFIDSIEHKWCSAKDCLTYHPLEHFGPAPKSKDGLRNICKNSRKSKPKIKILKFKIIDDIEYKYCEYHKIWHNVKEFGKDKRQEGGHNGYSISCKSSRRVVERKKKILVGENKECLLCELNMDLINFTKTGDSKYNVICQECVNKKEDLEFIVCSSQKDCINFSSLGLKLPKDKFNKEDHYCTDCRKEQRNKRNKTDYKFPSKSKVIVDGVDGKECSTKDCEWKHYSKFWKNKTYQDGYDKSCKICKFEFNKNYQENNPEKIKEYRKKYYEENKKTCIARSKKWKKDNPERIKKLSRERAKFRRDTEPEFKLKGNLRHRLNLALKNNSKSATTMALVGCTIMELWTHMESQFTDGMTRDNYGKWHVDHIIPCDSFDLSRPEEQRRCFNYRNLQPMWGSDNSIKGNIYKFNVVLEIELFSNIKIN